MHSWNFIGTSWPAGQYHLRQRVSVGWSRECCTRNLRSERCLFIRTCTCTRIYEVGVTSISVVRFGGDVIYPKVNGRNLTIRIFPKAAFENLSVRDGRLYPNDHPASAWVDLGKIAFQVLTRPLLPAALIGWRNRFTLPGFMTSNIRANGIEGSPLDLPCRSVLLQRSGRLGTSSSTATTACVSSRGSLPIAQRPPMRESLI